MPFLIMKSIETLYQAGNWPLWIDWGGGSSCWACVRTYHRSVTLLACALISHHRPPPIPDSSDGGGRSPYFRSNHLWYRP